nr:hypothetical protein Iba_chr02bCG10100 [Ipomoea batatas]GMD35320.1 hypothetical protein Iba_scaffold44350CG0010 [Ipomoea batatas]
MRVKGQKWHKKNKINKIREPPFPPPPPPSSAASPPLSATGDPPPAAAAPPPSSASRSSSLRLSSSSTRSSSSPFLAQYIPSELSPLPKRRSFRLSAPQPRAFLTSLHSKTNIDI